MTRRIIRLALLLAPALACARTIEMEASAIADRMAMIAEDAPLMSWAAYMPWTGVYYANVMEIQQGRAFLIRFPMGDIPKKQRITNAELILTVQLTTGPDPRIYVWRILSDWGVGVCHQYRMIRPKPLEWAVPGGRGTSQDRAVRPTAVARIIEPGELVVNVTEDVEIWNAAAAQNHGWMLTVEDPGVIVRAACPLSDYSSQWKLRVTFEPE